MARFEDDAADQGDTLSGSRLLLDTRFIVAFVFILSAIVGIATFRDVDVAYVAGTYPPAGPSGVMHLEITANDERTCNATACGRNIRNGTACLDKSRLDQFYLFNTGSAVAGMLSAFFIILGFIVARLCPDLPIPWAELLYMTFVLVYPLVTALSLVSLVAIIFVRANPIGDNADCGDVAAIPLGFAGGFAAHALKTGLSAVSSVIGVGYLVYLCCTQSGDDEPRTTARKVLTADEVTSANASRWSIMFSLLAIGAFAAAQTAPAALLSGRNAGLYGNAAGIVTYPANATVYLELRYETAYGCTTSRCADIPTLASKTVSDKIAYSRVFHLIAGLLQVLVFFFSFDGAIVIAARKSASSVIAYGTMLAVFVMQLLAVVFVCVAGGFIGSAQSAAKSAPELASLGHLDFAVGSALVVMSGVGALFNCVFTLVAFLARRRARKHAKDGMDAGLLEERPRNVRYM